MTRRIGAALAALLAVIVFGAIVVVRVGASKSGPITVLIAVVVTVACLAFLRFISVERLVGLLEGLRFAAPVFAYVAAMLFVGGQQAKTGFEEIGAQVIVVLLLALAIEARFFRIRAELERLELVSILLTLLILAVGEYYALNGLLAEEPAPAQVIAGAIAAGFAAIGVGALAGPRRSGD